MKYDFDKLIERRNTGCVKWDECPNSDIIPMWVADMDFAVAPAIQEAVRQRAEHPIYAYTLVGDEEHHTRTYFIYYRCCSCRVVYPASPHDGWRESCHAQPRLQLFFQ